MTWETDAEKRPTRITLLTGLLYLQAILAIYLALFSVGATYSTPNRFSSSVAVALIITVVIAGFLAVTGYLIFRQRRSGLFMLIAMLVLETANTGYVLVDPAQKFEIDAGFILYLATLFIALTTFKWFMTGRWKRL